MAAGHGQTSFATNHRALQVSSLVGEQRSISRNKFPIIVGISEPLPGQDQRPRMHRQHQINPARQKVSILQILARRYCLGHHCQEYYEAGSYTLYCWAYERILFRCRWLRPRPTVQSSVRHAIPQLKMWMLLFILFNGGISAQSMDSDIIASVASCLGSLSLDESLYGDAGTRLLRIQF